MIREYFEKRKKQKKIKKLTRKRLNLVNKLTRPLQELDAIKKEVKWAENNPKKTSIIDELVLSLKVTNYSLQAALHSIDGNLNGPIKARKLHERYEKLMKKSDFENRLKLINTNSSRTTYSYISGWGSSHSTEKCPTWEREWGDDYAYGKYLIELNLGEKLRNRTATYDEFIEGFKEMLFREVGRRGFLSEELGELAKSVQYADYNEREYCSEKFAHVSSRSPTYWREAIGIESNWKKTDLTEEEWENYKEQHLNPKRGNSN